MTWGVSLLPPLTEARQQEMARAQAPGWEAPRLAWEATTAELHSCKRADSGRLPGQLQADFFRSAAQPWL